MMKNILGALVALVVSTVLVGCGGGGVTLTSPRVISVFPPNGMVNAYRETFCDAAFDVAMYVPSFGPENFYINGVAGGVIQVHSNIANLNPDGLLAPNTTYTVTITGVTDLFDNPLALPYTWSFTTGSE